MDRKDLKIQALLEKITHLTTQYENQAADMRVELTIQSAETEAREAALNARIAELEAQVPGDDEEKSNPED